MNLRGLIWLATRLPGLGLLALAWVPAAGAAGPAQTTVQLVLDRASVRPGDTFTAGVHLRMPRGWHTYWKNSGDSGAPIRVEWDLPTGVTAGELHWPVPEKHLTAGLTTYVYHREVMLLSDFRTDPQIAAGALAIKAKVNWLECAELCIPGKTTVNATLTLGADNTPSEADSLIRERKAQLPSPNSGPVSAQWLGADDSQRSLKIDWRSEPGIESADFFPESSSEYEVAAPTERASSGTGFELRKTVRRFSGAWPKQIAGLLTAKTAAGQTVGWHSVLAVAEPVAAAGGDAALASTNDSAVAANADSTRTSTVGGANDPFAGKAWWFIYGCAFLGGLILNFMPCVLPVIALKVLGFVNQSRQSRSEVRRLGLLYGAGVLMSFLALALVVVGVQQAGRSANWGMQFQNPRFLLGLTVLVTLVALNLFGLFEVTLRGRAMGVAGELSSREGPLGAFFNGVLATALATPCTAPFLSLALGYAFSQRALVIISMFLVIGLGLALPYVLLSFAPGLSRFLPRPGAWMEKFKIAMGFPMLGTALWLLTLLAPHYGNRGVLWVGLFLTVLATAAWVWGEFVQRQSKTRGWGMAVAIGLILAAYYFSLERELNWRSPPVAQSEGTSHRVAGGIEWEPWSPEALAKARAENRPILVDFTADWCVTCQANKKLSLEIPSVRAKLKEINAIALLADYTTEDDVITAELKKFGRAAVPLVLVYPPGSEPEILPELLTPTIVLEALDRAAGKSPSK